MEEWREAQKRVAIRDMFNSEGWKYVEAYIQSAQRENARLLISERDQIRLFRLQGYATCLDRVLDLKNIMLNEEAAEEAAALADHSLAEE